MKIPCGFISLICAFSVAVAGLPCFVTAGNLPPEITAFSPSQSALDIDRTSSVSVTFDADMDEATLSGSTFLVTGAISGRMQGTIGYNNATRTATFIPLDAYASGDVVTVTLTEGIHSSGGESLAAPFQWSFTARADGIGTGRYDFGPAIPTGAPSAAIAAGDLNGDTFIDLVVPDHVNFTASVIFNNGDGTFSLDSAYALDGLSFHVCLGEFNGDDYMDIAAINWSADPEYDAVTLLLNAGDGTFIHQPPVPTRLKPRSAFPFDYDCDGDLDLATVNQSGKGDIALLANDGSGSLTLDTFYVVDSMMFFIDADDLNGDGFPDMTVSGSAYDTTFVLFNDGTGVFAKAGNYYTGSHPRGTTAGDFDGDGAPDIATAPDYSNGVGVVLNNGDGTFGGHAIYNSGNGPFTIGSGDVDCDGDLDLFTSNGGWGNSSILLNDGSGVFELERVYPIGDNYGSTLADLDGDGDLDLAAVLLASEEIQILYNKNRNIVASVYPPNLATSVDATDSVVLNFGVPFVSNSINDSTIIIRSGTLGMISGTRIESDPTTITFIPDEPFLPGDKITVSVTDAIEISSSDPYDKSFTSTFTVAPSGGVGDFRDATTMATDAQPRWLCATDLNGDDLPDIAIACATSHTIDVLINNGDSTFTAKTAGAVDRIPYHLVSADLDEDGFNDLIAASLGDHSISICYNDGAGSCRSIVNVTEGEKTSAIAAADFNGDGHIDVAAAKVYSDSVHVYWNDGEGNFSAPGDGYNVGGAPYTVIAADLDSDADQDMVLANYSDYNYISIFYNNGLGQFTQRSLIELFEYTPDVYDSAHSVYAGDFNGDGFNDLAVGNVWADTISVLMNTGTGSFESPVLYGVTSRPHAIHGGDFNADGHLDLAIADQTVPGYVSVLENNGDGTFAFWRDFQVGDSAHAVIAADIDVDGDVDLLAANGLSNTVSVLLNKDSIHVFDRPNPEFVPMGDSSMLEIGVYGDPDSVLLYYRLGGELTWTDTMLTATDSVYQCKIGTDPTGLRSTGYYFEVVQRDVIASIPETNPQTAPKYLRNQLTDIAVSGIVGNRYQMIGYPFDLDPGHPESLFVDNFGSYDTKRWRMGRWNPEKDPPGYDEFPEIDSIARGDGFWLFTRVGLLTDASGISAIPDTIIGDTVYGRYALKPGWNQISTPFAFSIAWDHCLADDSVEPVIYEYLGTDTAGPNYVSADTLRPFVGYFLMNNAQTVKYLHWPYVKGSLMPPTPLAAIIPGRNFWQARLSLESDGLSDVSNVIGARIDAADRLDKFDFSEPPSPPGDFVSLSFVGADGQGNHRLYSGDFRGPSSGWTFTLLVRGTTGRAGYLRLADTTLLPSEFQLVLIDTATGQSYSIPREGTVRIPQPLTPAGVRYRLLVGDEEYIAGNADNEPPVPDRYALYQNYPNPFNPATTIAYDLPAPSHVRIDIFNILGQSVTTLVDSDMPAGSHRIRWDGRDRDGTAVATGMYMYRLTTGTYTAVKKMMLLR